MNIVKNNNIISWDKFYYLSNPSHLGFLFRLFTVYFIYSLFLYLRQIMFNVYLPSLLHLIDNV